MTADKEIFFSNYDYYWLKYTMDRGIGEQARYLIAGHSLARFGINDRDIPGLINLAFPSQDYSMDQGRQQWRKKKHEFRHSCRHHSGAGWEKRKPNMSPKHREGTIVMNNDDFKCKFVEEELKTFWPQWHVVRRLGGGAIADVFEICRDDFEIREVSALKLIRIGDTGETAPFPSAEGTAPYRPKAGQPVIPEAFQNEIQIMEALQGAPNIVSINDYYLKKDESSTMLFVRMELLTSFRQLLAERQRNRQAFTVPEVLKIGRDICTALIYCEEKGVIHRDIKPANLFIDDFGNYRIGDFDVSRLLDSAHVAPAMTGIETISYMAPEVFSGLSYNNTVDIYALGLILYQLLNNCRVPFLPTEGPYTAKDFDNANYRRLQGGAIPSLAGIRAGDTQVDAALDAMIRKACAVRPKDRYQSAKAFYEDLAAWRTPQKTVLPMDDEQSRTTQVSFISHTQDADTSRDSTYSYRKAEEPVPKYPPKSDGRNVGNGQKKGGSGKGAVIALIMVVLLAFGGYIIMRVLHATQSSSPSNSMASSDSAYKEEVAKEEAAKEEAYKEEAAKEEAYKEEAAKEEAYKEEAAKEEAYKEEKESNSAENKMAKEDATPVGQSTEIVEIPDPVLKKAIQDTLGIGDREITESDALLLTQLEYDGYDNEKKEHKDQIKDLTGLEAFKNLTSLNLTSNQISDISVLSDMANLTELYLDDNRISDLSPLSGLTDLTKLWLGKNRIEDISALSGLTKLEQLCLYVNWISDISALSGMTGLTRLDLSNNQVSDISALSGMTNLERLYMKINQVSDISVLSALKKLQRLGLEYNQISDISAFAGLTKLETLRLYGNPVLDNKSREEILEVVSGAENLTEVDF